VADIKSRPPITIAPLPPAVEPVKSALVTRAESLYSHASRSPTVDVESVETTQNVQTTLHVNPSPQQQHAPLQQQHSSDAQTLSSYENSPAPDSAVDEEYMSDNSQGLRCTALTALKGKR